VELLEKLAGRRYAYFYPMTKRKLITILAALCLGLCTILLLWYEGSREVSDEGFLPAATEDLDEGVATGEESRIERIENLINKANFDILFRGRVVDENGTPISGAAVNVQVRTGRFGLMESVSDYPTATDDRGEFTIGGAVGYSFSVVGIAKEGYRLVSGQRVNFNRELISDSVQDYVMATVAKERTIEFFEYRLITNWAGVPVNIDLRLGEVEENGDLQLIPLRSDGEGRRLDWSLEINATNGGLLEAVEGVRSIAPINGDYRRSWKIAFDRNAEKYLSSITKNLFFKTQNDVFVRLHINIHSDVRRPNVPSINIRAFVNESGGRVLDDGTTRSLY
jgi:hypothetical protein